jgi:hypothetical protein
MKQVQSSTLPYITEGPWEVSETPKHIQILAPNGYVIATTKKIEGSEYQLPTAHLMAAARDMYEALEKLISDYKVISAQLYNNKAVSRICEQAEKTLNKANPNK